MMQLLFKAQRFLSNKYTQIDTILQLLFRAQRFLSNKYT